MSNLVEYEAYTAEDAQQELESMETSRFLKLEPGNTLVRFVPPRKGEGLFFVTYTHFLSFTGDDGKRKQFSVNCPRMMTKGQKGCPFCDRAQELQSRGGADAEAAKDLWPRRRVYSNVIDRDNPEKGVQVMPFGKKVHQELAKLRRDKVAGGDFADPLKGFDVVIERTGTGQFDTEYTVRRVPDRSRLAPTVPEMNELIANQPTLSRQGELIEYGQLQVIGAPILGTPTNGLTPEAAALPPAETPADDGMGGGDDIPF
jgi:hypothetical protein